MRVIGTAGHVDHGKSTLIAALTGIHPDRLKEEREREMTIDLGFAWLTLPDGELVGVVDVPGHRDFIENMLAGVGGIDAVLFVVAADEGVMPQTREHLAILDILQIQSGVIVISKVDLVEDPEWLEMVTTDVRQAVRNTVLAEAPCVYISARTGKGLEELKSVLSQVLARRPARLDLKRPRLSIDRAFTIAGFGTVVTGTLIDGAFHVGDEVEILPAGLHGRIRGLQTHQQKEEIAIPGSRTAINISGVSVDQLKRGEVVVLPGSYLPTSRLDVQFRLLADADGPLKHSSEIKFFLGAAEVSGRVRLLGKETLDPGEEGWLQLELSLPTTAVRGDRYILRRPSPGETLGGGVVLDPHPRQRHKRFSSEILTYLEALSKGTPEELLLQASQSVGFASASEVIARAHLEAEAAGEALQKLVAAGEVVVLTGGSSLPESSLVIDREGLAQAVSRSVGEIQAYLLANPLRRGMPREELKSRLKLSQQAFNALSGFIAGEGRLVESGTRVSLPGYEVRFSPQQQSQVKGLLARFAMSPYAPPSIKDCQAELGEELFAALVEQGVLTPVSNEVVFRKEDFQVMLDEVRRILSTEGTLTAAQFRDRFNTSRRYALAFLEHLDSSGVTVRDGDLRRLKK